MRKAVVIVPSEEEYQRRMNEALVNLDGVYVIVDDILVVGKGDSYEEAVADHDRKVILLFARLRPEPIKLNPSTTEFKKGQVKYMGHLITEDGVRTDPNKVRSIAEVNPPENVKQLKTFLGMVTYVAKFIPNLSEISEPLRILERKDIEWHWDETQQKAFEKIKELVK